MWYLMVSVSDPIVSWFDMNIITSVISGLLIEGLYACNAECVIGNVGWNN